MWRYWRLRFTLQLKFSLLFSQSISFWSFPLSGSTNLKYYSFDYPERIHSPSFCLTNISVPDYSFCSVSHFLSTTLLILDTFAGYAFYLDWFYITFTIHRSTSASWLYSYDKSIDREVQNFWFRFWTHVLLSSSVIAASQNIFNRDELRFH